MFILITVAYLAFTYRMTCRDSNQVSRQAGVLQPTDKINSERQRLEWQLRVCPDFAKKLCINQAYATRAPYKTSCEESLNFKFRLRKHLWRSAPIHCQRHIKKRFQKLFTRTIQIKIFEPMYLTKPNYVFLKEKPHCTRTVTWDWLPHIRYLGDTG